MLATAGTNKRGRPATGKGTQVVVRLQPSDLAALDAYIEQHPEPKLSRPEAIRRVLSERLSSKRPFRNAVSPYIADKAAKVRSKAASAADVEMEGMTVTTEEKTRRRRALTEKPEMVAKARAKRMTT